MSELLCLTTIPRPHFTHIFTFSETPKRYILGSLRRDEMKEVFKKLIIDFQERDFPNILARKFKIPLDSRKIVSLVGVRRSGKIFVLFDLINQLRQQHPRNILYINF